MVTWHLTVKLFTVKRHERATLRKLWNQTGNSSLLQPAKCWPPLHLNGTLESIGLCSKNRVWCFRASPVKTGYYAQIYARLEVLCSNYAGLKWHRFPLLATLYIPVRVAGKICIHLHVHLSQFSETTALCCKNISIMPGTAEIRFLRCDTAFCRSAVHLNKTTKCRQFQVVFAPSLDDS